MARAPDPRSVITPDAFSVDPPLLGTPLSPPGRRFWALTIDLMAVFMITAMTSSLWYVLPFVVGFFFLTRAAQKGSGRFSGVRRFSFGCLGFMVLVISGGIVLGGRLLTSGAADEAILGLLQEADFEGVPDLPEDASGLSLGTLLQGAPGAFEAAAQLQETDDPDEATEVALRFARTLKNGGLSDDAVELWLEEIMPDEIGGTDSDDIVEDALALLSEDSDEATVELSISDAMAEYSTWLALDGLERDGLRGAMLRRRIASDLAEDTISQLNERVEGLQSEATEALATASEAGQGFGPWLRSKLDTLSFGLGWWTMYFAILMPLMGGRTPGKKVMGIRVVRLDGQPITWWHAFERAGGYAAGLATGMLGFVQIYWDPNRQAIHDKVAGTVVVLEGAQPVPGQWEHLVAAEDVRIKRGAGADVPDAPAPPVDPDPTPPVDPDPTPRVDPDQTTP